MCDSIVGGTNVPRRSRAVKRFPGTRLSADGTVPTLAWGDCKSLASAEASPPSSFCMLEPPLNRAVIGIPLPPPRREGRMSVETALSRRRSVREFGPDALPLESVSQLLWAAQGVTEPSGKRTAPSAGAIYPLELLLVSGNVSQLGRGLYRYDPKAHTLSLLTGSDLRPPLALASLEQVWFREAPAILIVTAVYERMERKYRRRTERYVHMETGHVAQNVHLQAAALGFGTTVVGAFDDPQVKRVLGLPGDEHPLWLMPLGKPKTII
jgi:SagB-type dehydrogenase family enzyme